MPIKLVCLCVRFFTVWWHTQKKKNCFSWFFLCLLHSQELEGNKWTKEGTLWAWATEFKAFWRISFQSFQKNLVYRNYCLIPCIVYTTQEIFFATHSTLLGWVCAYHMIEIGDVEVWFAGALPGTLIYVCACPSDSVLVPAALSQISSIALFPTWHCSFRLHSQCIPFQFEILTFVIWFRVVFSDFEGKK